jgi:hypothetical protein
MIGAMAPMRLNLDTSPEIEQIQIDGWREMTAEQKIAIVRGLTRAAFELTLAGIRDRYPGASPHEQRLRLAIITLGRDLAEKAFPDVATLDTR